MRTSYNRSQSNNKQDIYNQETVEIPVNDMNEEVTEDNGLDFTDLDSGEDLLSGGNSIQEEITYRRNVIAYNKIEETIIKNNLVEEAESIPDMLDEENPNPPQLNDAYTYEEDMSQYEKKPMSKVALITIVIGIVIGALICAAFILNLIKSKDIEPPMEDTSSVVSVEPGAYDAELSSLQSDISALYTDNAKIDTVEGASKGSIDTLNAKLTEFKTLVSDTTEYDDKINKMRSEIETLDSYINDKRILTDLQKTDINLSSSDFTSYLASVKGNIEAYTVEGLRLTNNKKLTTLQEYLTDYEKLKNELKTSNIDFEKFDAAMFEARIKEIPYTVNQEELTQMLEVVKILKQSKDAEKEAADKSKSDEERNAAQKLIDELNKKYEDANKKVNELQQTIKDWQNQPTPTPEPAPTEKPTEEPTDTPSQSGEGESSTSLEDIKNIIGGFFNQGGGNGEES